MKEIYDSIHGYIAVSPLMIQFIDTPEFSRLRQIKQLGTAQFVYPSASHTRFEHCLGTAHLARRIAKRLINDLREIELVTLAGLLHDIGHGPMSHSFDNFCIANNVFKNSIYNHHEERSKYIIRYMVNKYSIALSKDEIEFICQCIHPPKKESDRIWQSYIISSDFDADRMDYILRDSTHTINRLSRHVVDNIINNLSRMDNKIIINTPNNAIKNNIQKFISARKSMYRDVYHHEISDEISDKVGKIMSITYREYIGKLTVEEFLLFPFVDSFIEYFYAQSGESKPLIEELYRRVW